MKYEIAIIGISVKVADADNLEEYWKFIEKGETGFNRLSAIRQKDVFDRFGEFDISMGSYLDRIDFFDNDFFKITPAEAERMDPEQRLMMECAVSAVNNAGYLVNELKGKRIGIFHTYGESRYRSFFDDSTNLSITSHMAGMVGTRVANFMDWRGPVIGFDTTCSSSLSALYYACTSIANGDCDMALTGGVSLGVGSIQMLKNSPVMSHKEQCLPFDDDADGTLGGEGVICLLIKKAEDAIRDGDPIHAIIKGGAINHGGALIQNISAPSPVSQSEVIKLAWKNSNVNPMDIRFIEAHGTGTILGDPIEFGGISAAFEEMNHNGKKVCSISSVKGQIGHLGSMAGLAGLTRLVLALKNKKLPPQTGFNKINSHIDEVNSPVSIQRHMEYWESDHLRLGGVSSFGLTGTNVHMILEEYAVPVTASPGTDGILTYAMKVAGATESKANKINEYLKQYLIRHPRVKPGELCYSVNKMLEDDQYGQVILFRNHNELASALKKVCFTKPRLKPSNQQVLMLIPGILTLENLSSFLALSKPLSEMYQFQLDKLVNDIEKLNENQQCLLLHYCAAQLLMKCGFSPDKIIGTQSGRMISLLLTGKIKIAEALSQLNSDDRVDGPFNSLAFIQFLDSLDSTTNYLIIAMGSNGEMIDTFHEWYKKSNNKNLQVIIPHNNADICQEIIAGYYNQGNHLNLEMLFSREPFLHDLHFPLFEPKRFWPVVSPVFAGPEMENKKPQIINEQEKYSLTQEEIIKGVHAIWCKQLSVETIDLQDDFFDLGGTSLMGLDVLQLIEKRFDVSLEYPDIFDYCTILSQAALIQEKLIKLQSAPSYKEKTGGIIEKAGDDFLKRHTGYDQLISRIRDQHLISDVSPKQILLTGGTGFLGVNVIKELLSATGARIYCLVRGETNEIAKERFMHTMHGYFPGDKLDYTRITIVNGDITKPGLGFSADTEKSLNNIDTVYHLAANVSHYGKAELIDGINFKGTVNLLEWSKKSGVKHFHYFSTTAVALGGYIENIESCNFYETDLDLGQNFGRHLYPASKFKAELYIRENAGNLNVDVFRIGNIGGHSETGLFQNNIETNNFYQRLKMLVDLGCYCDEIAGYSFETTPVDIVSKITVRLSLLKNEVLNTFHILEPNPICLEEMVQHLSHYNIDFRKVDMDSFLHHVDTLSANADFSAENAIVGIVRYSNNDTPVTEYTINQSATRAYLNKTGIDFGYDREQYAGTLIKYCIERNFIREIKKGVRA